MANPLVIDFTELEESIEDSVVENSKLTEAVNAKLTAGEYEITNENPEIQYVKVNVDLTIGLVKDEEN